GRRQGAQGNRTVRRGTARPRIRSKRGRPRAGSDSARSAPSGLPGVREPPRYDGKTNREAARKRGICPVIAYRSNIIDKPKFFAKVLYKARARIEQMMGKIKRFKRIALRCEKTARNYASFLALVCGFILIKSVHAALGWEPIQSVDSMIYFAMI